MMMPRSRPPLPGPSRRLVARRPWHLAWPRRFVAALALALGGLVVPSAPAAEDQAGITTAWPLSVDTQDMEVRLFRLARGRPRWRSPAVARGVQPRGDRRRRPGSRSRPSGVAWVSLARGHRPRCAHHHPQRPGGDQDRARGRERSGQRAHRGAPARQPARTPARAPPRPRAHRHRGPPGAPAGGLAHRHGAARHRHRPRALPAGAHRRPARGGADRAQPLGAGGEHPIHARA